MSDPVYNKLAFNGYIVYVDDKLSGTIEDRFHNLTTKDAIDSYYRVRVNCISALDEVELPTPKQMAMALNTLWRECRTKCSVHRIEDKDKNVLWEADD